MLKETLCENAGWAFLMAENEAQVAEQKGVSMLVQAAAPWTSRRTLDAHMHSWSQAAQAPNLLYVVLVGDGVDTFDKAFAEKASKL